LGEPQGMITITLGTIPFQFDRIIQWIEILLKDGTISEPVFVQYGVSNISSIEKHPLITVAPIIEHEKLLQLVTNSRLVISHAGQGSTRWLASCQASFVIVPRLAQYGEHIDDHQLSFAKSVESFGVQFCLLLEELRNSIQNPPVPFQGQLLSGPKLVDHLLQSYSTEPNLKSQNKSFFKPRVFEGVRELQE
jgi:UDP-N-acetylglucosamine transferase subunit ALG13